MESDKRNLCAYPIFIVHIYTGGTMDDVKLITLLKVYETGNYTRAA